MIKHLNSYKNGRIILYAIEQRLTRKELIKFLLMVYILYTAISCNSTDPLAETPVELSTVTVIYAPNGLGDVGYNDNICRGVYRSYKQHGFQLHNIVPKSINEAEEYLTLWLKQYNSSSERDLLLLACDAYEPLVRKYAAQIPDNSHSSVLLLESRVTDLPAYTIYLPLYGASYEAGVLAASLDDVVAPLIITANDDSSLLADGRKGFSDGFSTIRNSTPDYFPLSNGEQGYSMADSLYMYSTLLNNIYDFIYPLVGGSFQGLLRYVREHENSFFLAGIDINANLYFDGIPFSVVKHIDKVVEYSINSWINGVILPRHQTFGLDSEMVEIVLSILYEDTLQSKLLNIHSQAILKEEAYEASKR